MQKTNKKAVDMATLFLILLHILVLVPLAKLQLIPNLSYTYA